MIFLKSEVVFDYKVQKKAEVMEKVKSWAERRKNLGKKRSKNIMPLTGEEAERIQLFAENHIFVWHQTTGSLIEVDCSGGQGELKKSRERRSLGTDQKWGRNKRKNMDTGTDDDKNSTDYKDITDVKTKTSSKKADQVTTATAVEVNVCGVFKECIDLKNTVEQNGSENVDNITEVEKLRLSENTTV